MPKKRKKGDMLDDVAGAVLAASVPVPLGVVVGPVGKRLFREMRQESKRRGSEAIKVAASEASMSREELAEHIQNTPRLIPLATRVLYAAGMNGQDETLVMLGAVFGQAAAGDEEDIDDAEVLLSVIDGLGKRHVEMLKLMSQPPDAERYPGFDRWNTGLLQMEMEATGVKQGIALVALAGLINTGLIQELGFDGGTTWGGGGTVLAVTENGELLLEVLRKYRGAA